jgi:SAM-dependent methyltransferase
MELSKVAEIHQGYKDRSFCATIAPDDGMLIQGQESAYFSAGEDGLNNVLASLARSRCQKVQAILDLPCGHGRVARHLRTAFPDAAISFCDIDGEGVNFCSQTFDGRAIYSRPELTHVPLGGPFDVIWIGSLFTHVDETRTQRWLRYLCGHLSEDGLLLASFHGTWSREVQERYNKMIPDQEWAAILEQTDRAGFGYAKYPNFRDYGISLVRPSKPIELAAAIEGIRILSYVERGWADHQDVLTIARTDRRKPWIG